MEIEKKWYSKASLDAQTKVQKIYVSLFKIGLLLKGRDFEQYVKDYIKNRGMDFYHDVHDWLGGWPYETISPKEVESLMRRLDYVPISLVVGRRGRLFGRNLGVFGSGCDEYVYQRS